MAGQQRKCANCRYFQDAGLPGNGWCTHPKRQHSNDVKILVRGGELACRNSWGGDLFQSRFQQDASTAADADLPGDSRDDEVTSVVIPPSGRPAEEDRIVSDRPAPRFTNDDYNEAARIEQDERARIMARGSRDALRSARERHSNRRHQLVPEQGDDGKGEREDRLAADRVVSHQARFSDRFLTPTSGPDRQPIDDAPVPRAEVERRLPTPPDRFDTVPEVDPEFEMPAWNAGESPVETLDTPESPEAEPGRIEAAAAAQPSAYEHVLQRARRIREHKVRQAAQPLRHADLGVDRIIPPEPVADDPPGTDEPEWVAASDGWDDRADAGDPAVAVSWHDEADPRVDDDGWDDQRVDDVQLGFSSEDGAYDDEFEDDEVYAPAPHARRSRSGSWFSRFTLRKRGPSLSHDDGTVTRHADWDDWHAPEADDDRRGAEPWDAPWDARETEVEETYAPAAARLYEAAAEPAGRWPEEWVDPAQDTAPQPVVSAVTFEDEDVDDAIAYLDEPEPAPQRVAPPAQPARETWHRRRYTTELPDLDDNLFDERFERTRGTAAPRMAARGTSGERPERHAEPAAADPGGSPRDSWFRAARFRDWPDTRQDEHAPESGGGRSRGASGRLPELREEGLDLRELVARGGELLDMTIDVAPDVPRECRTCRSFRSADGGARGWCTNEWAFTHRRMVNEDDLACETSIGCWWLPADRYVIVDDENGYASATPRIDEMIARHEPAASRRVSGD